MAKSVAEVHDLFRSGFPRAARIQLVSCAVQAHGAARTLIRDHGFDGQLARDAFPGLLRLDFQTRISNLVIPGVAIDVRQNVKGTSSFVEMTSESVTLTSLTRARPPRQLPAAHYRKTRAEASQTLLRFPGQPAEPESDADRLYGVYVYGGVRQLHLGRVYFPVPEPKKLCAIPPLDLLAEYQSVVGSWREAAEASRPTEAAAEFVLGLRDAPKDSEG